MTDESRKCVYCPAIYRTFEEMIVHLELDHGAYQAVVTVQDHEERIDREVHRFAKALEEWDDVG